MNLDIHGQQYKPEIIMSIILLATFAGALMQTSLGTALPTLMNDFDIDFSTAQQASIDGFNTAFIIGIFFALVGVLIVPFLKMNSSESEDK
ncbi:hypothetical protein QI203_07965 [Staphylococcus saprophyticus]|nr:hypothetical protein [Staphylococcus saprophyticus]